MAVTNELLFAYIDGELEGEELVPVATQLALDAELALTVEQERELRLNPPAYPKVADELLANLANRGVAQGFESQNMIGKNEIERHDKPSRIYGFRLIMSFSAMAATFVASVAFGTMLRLVVPH